MPLIKHNLQYNYIINICSLVTRDRFTVGMYIMNQMSNKNELRHQFIKYSIHPVTMILSHTIHILLPYLLNICWYITQHGTLNELAEIYVS